MERGDDPGEPIGLVNPDSILSSFLCIQARLVMMMVKVIVVVVMVVVSCSSYWRFSKVENVFFFRNFLLTVLPYVIGVPLHYDVSFCGPTLLS